MIALIEGQEKFRDTYFSELFLFHDEGLIYYSNVGKHKAPPPNLAKRCIEGGSLAEEHELVCLNLQTASRARPPLRTACRSLGRSRTTEYIQLR